MIKRKKINELSNERIFKLIYRTRLLYSLLKKEIRKRDKENKRFIK